MQLVGCSQPRYTPSYHHYISLHFRVAVNGAVSGQFVLRPKSSDLGINEQLDFPSGKKAEYRQVISFSGMFNEGLQIDLVKCINLPKMCFCCFFFFIKKKYNH